MKLKEIFSNGWYEKLTPYINSESFFTAGKELQRRKKENIPFTPALENIFDAFKWCPYKDLKVVFLFDGLTYDQTKQDYFWKAIENEEYNGLNLNLDKSLERLAKQGVLFLNKSLTEGDADLWKDFYTFVIKLIRDYNSGIIFVGNFKNAVDEGLFNNWASSNNIFLPCSEPFSKTSFSEKWETGGILSMINIYLKQTNNTKIEW